MKVLFICPDAHDYVLVALHYGMCELFGPDNVIDYDGTKTFHPPKEGTNPISKPAWFPGSAFQEDLPAKEDRVQPALYGHVDLVIVSEAYHWFTRWNEVSAFISMIPLETKVSYVIGHDSDQKFPIPPFRVDVTFQREINLLQKYGYNPIPLYMALPLCRMLEKVDTDRPIDVAYVGHPSNPLRDAWVRQIGSSNLTFVLGRGAGLIYNNHYLDILRRSKFALCPPGAGWDCARTWEAVACGCVPVFSVSTTLKQPEFFADNEAIFAKEHDCLEARITRCKDNWQHIAETCLQRSREHHTTQRRAEYVLDHVFGKDIWRSI